MHGTPFGTVPAENACHCVRCLNYAELCWTVLRYAELCWTMLNCVELCWTMLNYAEPRWTAPDYKKSGWTSQTSPNYSELLRTALNYLHQSVSLSRDLARKEDGRPAKMHSSYSFSCWRVHTNTHCQNTQISVFSNCILQLYSSTALFSTVTLRCLAKKQPRFVSNEKSRTLAGRTVRNRRASIAMNLSYR